MKRAKVIERLKAGEELVDDTFWGYHRCWLSGGLHKVLHHQLKYLENAGLLSKARHEKGQDYYRWAGDAPGQEVRAP